MRPAAALVLYRALLREARRQLVTRHPGLALAVRAPVSGEPGSYDAHTAVGQAYHLACLDGLVPGLAVLPQQLPLDYHALRQLIRDNFKANKGRRDDPLPGFSALDQGFAALRCLPQQAYLEACSSSSASDGVLVDATSCFSHVAPPRHVLLGGGSSSGEQESWFVYRIRITNTRQHPVCVLGRGWVVSNASGELEGFVKLADDNGLVGQQPVIPPGACWQYHSRTPLRGSVGRGSMMGQLLVELREPAAGGQGAAAHNTKMRGVARVVVPVAEFRLQTMAAAGTAGDNSSSGDGGGGSDFATVGSDAPVASADASAAGAG